MRPPRLSLTLRFQHQYPHSPHTQNGAFVMLHRSSTSGGKPPSRERCDVVQSQLEISSSCLISILITNVNSVAFSSSRQIRPRQIEHLYDLVGNWAPHFFGAQFAIFGKFGPGQLGPSRLCPGEFSLGKLPPRKTIAYYAIV